MPIITTIQGSDIVELDNGSVAFDAGATLDGDGANGQFGQPPCYAPSTYAGGTLDYLGNAGNPGNWYGVVTDNSNSTGRPLVQTEDDPCPGAYISTTALELSGPNGERLPDSSPFKYVDSATVPYIVVPPQVVQGVPGIVLGCRCVITNTVSKQSVEGVVADIGPHNHLGEISIACAKAIGVKVGTTHAAAGDGAPSPTIHYQLFPGQAAVVNDVTYRLQAS